MDKFEKHIKRMKGLRDVYEAGTGQHNILSMLITECEIALRQPPVMPRSIPDKLYLLIAEAKAKRYGNGFAQIEKQGAYSDGQCDTIDIIEEWLRSL